MKKLSLLIALLVVVCYRILKVLSNRSMLHGSFGFIHFAYLHNYGAMMGILRGDRLLLVAIGIVAFAVLVAMWFKVKSSSIWFWIGWALLMGGTVGNLWDRLIYGSVTDMLQIPYIQLYSTCGYWSSDRRDYNADWILSKIIESSCKCPSETGR
ncbi:signal peptidase II [Alicyclobacillus fastidiosus]|uniref:Signal peptidase II n=1 Tax=Alicyclobacillus fastidiosus TaxID=392011 RepID=A0ABV5AIE1_9BACL|nr:signal peptidase II [Alicyclobacillus fastidiosus]WEH10086.1 signal peptidase II [Alicyclobacillus fastidiosus]